MMQLTINALHHRDGRPFTGKVETTDKGKPCFWYVAKCNRCGGAGGSDKWKHTGWTCFECGGSGKGHHVCEKLYTLDQLEKLNAAQAKRDAKKAAINAALAAAREAERASRRETFVITNKGFFAQAALLNDEFVNTMIAQCIERASISAAQIELIEKKIKETARKQAISYVGEVGARQEFTCTLFNFRVFDGKFGRTYLHIMRDASGNTIKYMGSSILGNITWEGKYDEAYPVWNKEEKINFTATIKAHEEYNGEKQTVVARPKEAK